MTRSSSTALLVLIASTTSSSAFSPSLMRPAATSSHAAASSFATTSSFGTVLGMAKNAHRASYERQLEELMDNDWRVFRAKLVAQERAQGQTDSTTTATEKPPSHDDDERLVKQKQVTDFFGGVIAAFFKNSNNKKEDLHGTIFDGEFIGGAHSAADDISKLLPEGVSEDPFLSLEELPILIPKFKDIDKHKWAHELSHVEPGCVLVANEKLGGVFHQTVVLIVQHSDKQGTMGIVINRYVSVYWRIVRLMCDISGALTHVCFINRPMDGDLMKIASEQDTKLDLSLKLAFSRSPVTYGGPVLNDEFTVLHGFGEVEGSRKLCPGVFVGGSEELMDEVRLNNFDPRNALFIKGHASWVPGQLSSEIQKGVWYIAAASSHMILRYANPPKKNKDAAKGDKLWGDVLACMGGKFEQIAKDFDKSGDKHKAP